MITLESLPYGIDSLSPYISRETLDFHHNKHHQAYVDNLNKLIQNTSFENNNLVEIITSTFNVDEYSSIFNNAAQVWNHDFYFKSLSLGIGMSNEIKDLLINNFGSIEDFKTQFKSIALGQFGSGWVWVIEEMGKIKIVKTSNANNPLTFGYKPLLGIDLWEHSYYLDYQNRRGDYLDNIINNLINWQFFKDNLTNDSNRQ